MKKAILTGVICASTVLMLGITSCSDDYSPAGSAATGRIAPLVDLQSEPITAQDRGSRADTQTPSVSVDDLKIRVVSDDGTVNKTYDSYKTFPTDEEFKIGNYTISAFYGEDGTIGYDKPYYYGEQYIKVEADKETRVDLTATLAKSMVSVAYTDAFKNYMISYSATLQKESSPFSYVSKENRPVYLKSGTVTLHVAFKKPNGNGGELEIARFNALPRHHYRLVVDVNEGNVGSVALSVILDDTFTEEVRTIDLSDELLNAPAPDITPSGFTPGEPVEIIGNTTPADGLKMNIIARGGIRNVSLSTKCSSLIADGWPAEIDLVSADASQRALLEQLGLKTMGVWNNPDQMAVIDFSGVAAVVESPAEFTVNVTDIIGKNAEVPMTLSVTPVPVTADISNMKPLNLYDDKLMFSLSSNAVDPVSQIRFQLKNSRGTWDDADAVISPVSRAVDVLYNVTLTVPANDEDLTFHCLYNGNQINDPIDVQRATPDFNISVSDRDCFARYALLTFSGASNPSSLSIETSIDNGETWQSASTIISGSDIKVTSLEPSTSYKVRAAVDGLYSRSLSFTTEPAVQLVNGNMDQWITEDGLTQYWWYAYPGENKDTYWGTMNLLTTSQGGNRTTMFTHNGCAYNAISGTDKTDDSHQGYAAVIRTAGWGNGNSATANASGTHMGTCENVTAGELYLGKYDNGPQYGIEFTSRPSAISFWFKYEPKNSSDRGVITAVLKDADGNIIGKEDEFIVTAVNKYEQHTMTLIGEMEKCNKAATLQLIFKSSNQDVNNLKNTDWLTPPPFANLSDGTYLGSQLYIDDIELIY